MNHKLFLILFVAAVSLSTTTTTKADFTPIVGWDNQLFPSFIIGTAAIKSGEAQASATELGDINGMLGIEIVAPHDDAAIEVTIECNEFMEPSRFVGRLEKKGETYRIFPKVKYRFDRLSECSQATPADVSFRSVVDDSDAEEKSTTVTFRSVNDCPLRVVLGGDVLDTSFVIASYVNEQHPFIDKLLREALDIGIVDNFTGYQSGKEEQVLLQVYAIWDLLVARDVRYSSITKTAADSEIILSQNVRLLEDTINNQQANCVDGSVLLASILRKIDIEARLILVPGHCYIGFYLDREHTKLVALETTLLGAAVDEPEDVFEALDNAVEESSRDAYSWPSFVAAITTGVHEFSQSREKFESASESEYHVVDISAARKIGMLPIPHRNKEVFVQFDHSSFEGEAPEEGAEMDSEEAAMDEEAESDSDSDEDE
jgi:hypothetical protein